MKKGENNLFEYEEKLGFMKKTLEQEEKINEILSEIDLIEGTLKSDALKNVKNKLKGLV